MPDGVTADRVIVDLEARVGNYNRRIQDAERRFDRSMTAIGGSARRAETAVSRSFGGIATAAAAVTAALGVRAIQTYADAWTTAGNKIGAASKVSGLAAASLSDIADIATRTRSDFEGIADLYARLLRTGAQVGASQEEIAQATEIAAKAFKAGGAAASEQAAAVLQLGQALGSGVLQGDELRSIRENAPLLAQAIADEFNVTIAGLKKLGEDGKLTSERVFRAIVNAQGKIESQFAATNSTIADGFTNLRTALIRFVGDADDAIGATEGLVKALTVLSKNLDIAAAAMALLAARGIAPLAAALATRLAAAAGTAATALQLLVVRGGAAVVATQALTGALALLGGPVGALVVGITGAIIAFNQFDTGARTSEEGINRLKGAMGALQQSLNDLSGVESALKSDTEQLERANKALNDAVASGGDIATATAQADVAAISRRIQANEQLRDAILATIQAQAQALRAEALVAERAFRQEFAGGAATFQRPVATGASAGEFGTVSPRGEELIRLQEEALKDFGRAAEEALAAGTVTELQSKFLTARKEILLTTTAAQELEANVARVLSGEGLPTTGTGTRTVTGTGGGGAGSKEKQNEFERELATIAERAAALVAVIEAQRGLNPLVDDYAVKLSAAATEADLLAAAQKAGVDVNREFVRGVAEGIAELEAQADGVREFAGAVDSIKDRIAQLRIETETLAGVNPIIRDYGEELETARARAELLNLAQQAGLEITPELAAAINELAGNYGKASAEAAKLAAEQAFLQDTFTEFQDTAKDGLKSFITDVINGRNALESLADVLDQIASKLLDLAFEAAFNPAAGGTAGGGGGILAAVQGIASIFSVFAARKGGVMTDKGPVPLKTYQTGGVARTPQMALFGEGSTPEAFVPLPDGRRIPVKLDFPDVPATKITESASSTTINLGGLTVNGARSIDEFRRARVQLMADLQRDLVKVAGRNTA